MSTIRGWKIRTRLLAAFLVALAPPLIGTGVGVAGLWMTRQRVAALYDELTAEYGSLLNLEADLDRLHGAVSGYQGSRSPAEKAGLDQALARLGQALARLQAAGFDDAEEKGLVEALKDRGREIEALGREILKAPDVPEIGGTRAKSEALRHRIAEASEMVNRAQALSFREIRQGRQRISETIALLMALGLGTLVLSVAASLALTASLSAWLSRPILRIAQASRRMADGDLSQRLEIQTGGELAGAAQAFNEMAERLEASTRENVRLRDSADRRAQQLATLNDLSRTLTTVLDPAQVARAILAAVQVLVPDAVGRLWEWREDGHVVRLVASVGLRGAGCGEILQLRPDEGLTGIAVSTRQPVTSAEVAHDPRFIAKEWAAAEGLASSAIVPLIRGDRIAGALAVYTRSTHEFSEDEVKLLRSFAAQAAIAIENARLYEEIRRHAEELEARVKERTAALEKALQVKAEFLRNMSHELRTPLNFVLGFADVLKGGAAGPLTGKQAHFVEHIQTGARRLLELVTDLLDISQLEAGRTGLKLESVPLAPLVHEIVGAMRVQAAQKQLSVKTELSPDASRMVGDRDKLSSILAHLVGNAVKFTPEGGTITLTARKLEGEQARTPDSVPAFQPASQPAGEWLEIAVADTGIGIAREDLERIFIPFHQVDSSDTRAHGGAGLGLALVRKLVELHGGRVWAESEGPGQGARFVVRLPRLEAPPGRERSWERLAGQAG